jgi:hypothetical protein
MDKLIEDGRLGYYLTQTVLSHDKNIIMVRAFHVNPDINERYMVDIIIMCGEKLITTNTIDSLQLNEELALFDRGDENNKFLKIVQQKGKDSLVYSLKLSLGDGNVIYIGRSEAKAMNRIWDMSFQRFSFTRLLEDVQPTDAEDWSKRLYSQRYISSETYERTKRPFDYDRD